MFLSGRVFSIMIQSMVRVDPLPIRFDQGFLPPHIARTTPKTTRLTDPQHPTESTRMGDRSRSILIRRGPSVRSIITQLGLLRMPSRRRREPRGRLLSRKLGWQRSWSPCAATFREISRIVRLLSTGVTRMLCFLERDVSGSRGSSDGLEVVCRHVLRTDRRVRIGVSLEVRHGGLYLTRLRGVRSAWS